MTKVKMVNDGGILRFSGKSDDPKATEATFNSLQRNGTFCPGIETVTVNTPEDGKVQGSIHVKFKDGTKVTVKNMEKDQFSAEVGLLYAIVKRLYGNVKDNDEVSCGSYMHKINDILKHAIYPREEEIEKVRAEKDAKAKAAKAKAEEKAARVSEMKEIIAEVLKDMGVTIRKNH